MASVGTPTSGLDWPLMKNNISRADLDAVCAFLQQDDPILTQSRQVRAFEEEWSAWLGVRHSVFVNSGSSANLLTLAALKERHGGGEIIVPTITWASDIASVLHCGFEPVFVDVARRTLGMDLAQVLDTITPRTRAVFLTHVLGFNALTSWFVDELRRRDVLLLEDVCESHGACLSERRLGSIGWASNFSFYYAHHLSTIEGGMICTSDTDLYETLRMLRSHGLVRELDSASRRREYWDEHPYLNPEFIFALPGFNVRGTEINAVIGRTQLPRLDQNVAQRNENLRLFLGYLDPNIYQVDFDGAGCSNYAFPLILRRPNVELFERIMKTLRAHGVEYRRGTSGGGNQVRQPYLRKRVGPDAWKAFPNADHVHFYGMYIGNYPTLERDKIMRLCTLLNSQ
jgi:CDP-6-deoxy-D-xylo-4-hexulose-3-dehydrase